MIDDHCFFDFDEDIKKHLVLTDYNVGLTEKDVEKAVTILNM